MHNLDITIQQSKIVIDGDRVIDRVIDRLIEEVEESNGKRNLLEKIIFEIKKIMGMCILY